MFKRWRAAKLSICRFLLCQIEPDIDKIIGESIGQAIDEKMSEWEIALLSLQAEVAEDFEGGLLHGVPSVAALREKIRKETRAWKLAQLRENKLSRIMNVDHQGQLVSRARGLVKIDSTRERERVIFDNALLEVKKAKNAFNQALVILYDLQRSFDLEYRVHNVLDFEEAIEKESRKE